jgi:hypothetical protein
MNSGDTLYRVQLLALQTPIKHENYFGLLYSKIPGLKIEESQDEDGLYLYSTGVFTSMDEARKLEALIRNSGWIDCFIATYISGKR